jgi:hypothetical protein
LELEVVQSDIRDTQARLLDGVEFRISDETAMVELDDGALLVIS